MLLINYSWPRTMNCPDKLWCYNQSYYDGYEIAWAGFEIEAPTGLTDTWCQICLWLVPETRPKFNTGDNHVTPSSENKQWKILVQSLHTCMHSNWIPADTAEIANWFSQKNKISGFGSSATLQKTDTYHTWISETDFHYITSYYGIYNQLNYTCWLEYKDLPWSLCKYHDMTWSFSHMQMQGLLLNPGIFISRQHTTVTCYKLMSEFLSSLGISDE